MSVHHADAQLRVRQWRQTVASREAIRVREPREERRWGERSQDDGRDLLTQIINHKGRSRVKVKDKVQYYVYVEVCECEQST